MVLNYRPNSMRNLFEWVKGVIVILKFLTRPCFSKCLKADVKIGLGFVLFLAFQKDEYSTKSLASSAEKN